MSIEDVYLLALHNPYESPEHPVAVNATIVHALTLLHPGVPQPDGGRMYRCLTEFPARTSGCVVPLSTLTFELNGGQLWSQVADWEAVVTALVRLSRDKECDAMPLGLPTAVSALLANGPATTITVYGPDGGRSLVGGRERDEYIRELAEAVRSFTRGGPFFPGGNLTMPPRDPAVMPYLPYRS